MNSATDWYFASLGLAGTPWADVSRTGLGTRVDSAGLVGFGPHNLLLHSNNLANAVWTSTLGASSTATTVTIGTGATSEVRQTVAVATAGQTFTVQAKVSVASGTRLFRFKNTHGGVVDNFSANFTATTTPTLFTYTVTNSASPGEGAQIFGVVNASDASSNGATFTVTDLQINVGAATPYVPTTTAARYLPRITHDPRLDVNGNPYTVTEQYGAERITNGAFATNTTGWSLVGAGGSMAAVSGELEITGSGGGYPGARQTLTGLTVGNTYRLTCSARRGTTAQNVTVFAGSASVTVTGTASTPVSMFFVAASTSVNIEILINAGAASGTAYVDNVSVQEYLGTVTNGTPRPLGLLVEGQGTQLFTRTDNLSASPWALQGVTVQATRVAGPDGALSAQRFTPTLADAALTQDVVPASAIAHTHSVWLRSATGSNFDIALRLIRDLPFVTVASQTITVTAEWQRFVFAATPLDTTNHRWRIGSGSVWGLGEVLDVWGPQLETGPTATSYIPNPGAGSAVRVADSAGPGVALTGAALAAAFPAGYGQNTIVLKFRKGYSLASNETLLGFGTGSSYGAGNFLVIRTNGSELIFGSYNSGTQDSGLILDGSLNTVAVSWNAAGAMAVSVNGRATQAIASGGDFTGIGTTHAILGAMTTAGLQPLSQAIFESLRVLPGQYIIGAALQALTA